MNAISPERPMSRDEAPVLLYPLHWAQNDAVRGLADGFDAGHKRQYVDMPTGTGKTAVPLSMMEMMRSAGRTPRVLVMTDTRALVGQILEEIREFTPKLAPLASRYVIGDEKMKTPVAVCTYASGIKALEKGALLSKNFDFIVLDEAHHVLSELRDSVLNAAECPIIALTATPDYNARKGLRSVGYHEAFHVSLQKAEETGLICPTRNILLTIEDSAYSLDSVNLVGRGEEYDDEALDPILTREGLGLSVASFYKDWRDPDTGRGLADMVGVAYCNSIKHAKLMEDEINKALIHDVPAGVLPARAVWGKMPQNSLNAILQAHKKGEIRHLMSVDYLIEGYNNRKIEVIFNIRPTRSNVVAGQRPGRGARLDPDRSGKVNKVFDVIYPAEQGRAQILYADTLSLDFSKSKSTACKNEKLESHGEAPAIKVHQKPVDVEAYINQRNRKSLRLSGLTSDHVLPAVAKSMLDCVPPFTNGADLARAVRKQVEHTSWTDKEKKAAGDYGTVLNVMTGKDTMTADGTDYSLTAYALSVVLATRLEDLFGRTREELVREDNCNGRVEGFSTTREIRDDDALLFEDPDDIVSDADDLNELSIEQRDERGALTGFDGSMSLTEQNYDFAQADTWEPLEQAQMQRAVNHALKDITERERHILQSQFGFYQEEERTLDQIGAEMDYSREGVRNIRDKAIRKFKHPSRSGPLKAVFDGEGSEYVRPVDIEYLDAAYEPRLKQSYDAALKVIREIQHDILRLAVNEAVNYRREVEGRRHDLQETPRFQAACRISDRFFAGLGFADQPSVHEDLKFFTTQRELLKFEVLPKDYKNLVDFMQAARAKSDTSVEKQAHDWMSRRLVFGGPGNSVLMIT